MINQARKLSRGENIVAAFMAEFCLTSGGNLMVAGRKDGVAGSTFGFVYCGLVGQDVRGP